MSHIFICRCIMALIMKIIVRLIHGFEIQPDTSGFYVDKLLRIHDQRYLSLGIHRHLKVADNLSDRSFWLHQREAHSEADTWTISEGQKNTFVLESFDTAVLGIEPFWVKLLRLRIMIC